VLIQMRKAVAESQQVFAKMSQDLPPLITEMRAMSQNMSDLMEQARGGVEHASVLLHAMGEVGESVQQVHNVVRGSGGTLLTNVASVVAGFKAATRVMKDRLGKEGGSHNGG
jgi:uncharacterized protein YoxC